MSRSVLQVAYDGRVFRSKTEARWARCFDALGVAYQHEPTVFRFERGHGRVAHYKPDFYLPELEAWLEIKNEGTRPPDLLACWKAHRLALATSQPVYVFFGEPMGQRTLRCGNAYRYDPLDGSVSRCHQFTQCPQCKRIDVAPYGLASAVRCGCTIRSWGGADFSNSGCVALVEAVAAARMHRFRTLGQ